MLVQFTTLQTTKLIKTHVLQIKKKFTMKFGYVLKLNFWGVSVNCF